MGFDSYGKQMQIIPTDFHCRQFRILEIVTCFLRKTAKTASKSNGTLYGLNRWNYEFELRIFSFFSHFQLPGKRGSGAGGWMIQAKVPFINYVST